ncbi:2-oxoglutarate and iron-dependent oxygenase domain-containing protein 2-like isoform X1 [Physella acuta]|uniref:2-oxoglutarate and iron-dependent oxygenase domain-containing protein 2-like isoform X1 n=1 Tax=Physella acuta TaxID=109671 RepID=UPI0027DDB6A8|nr:2-oxoglutarate and iron-dependent oxygenase domain-containing protein 2-like isoform X1 [Physella acuta]
MRESHRTKGCFLVFLIRCNIIAMTTLSRQPEYICRCYLNKNIFIKKFRIHTTYESDEQFEKEFRSLLRLNGCSTDKQYQNTLSGVHEEIKRRSTYHKQFLENYEYNQQHYEKLNPEIWSLQPCFLDPRFVTIAHDATGLSKEKLMSLILHMGGDITEAMVYKLPVFTKAFCFKLIDEISNFEKFPGRKTRPNTMNASGISLDEMGLSDSLITSLVRDYFQPITRILFPHWGGGLIDSYRAFIVKYEAHGDRELSLHFDNSEITANISINEDYEGGQLQVRKMSTAAGVDEEFSEPMVKISHEMCFGLLHCGRQHHSALPLNQGIRYNLVIWMRSSEVRNKMCPMCHDVPDLIEVPIAGDGFIPIKKSKHTCSYL